MRGKQPLSVQVPPGPSSRVSAGLSCVHAVIRAYTSEELKWSQLKTVGQQS